MDDLHIIKPNLQLNAADNSPHEQIDMTAIKSFLAGDFNRQIRTVSEAHILDTNEISDGYHTFGELYEHRIQLWIALCRAEQLVAHYQGFPNPVWRTFRHSNGSSFDGWFILGKGYDAGCQITYHLPSSKWSECGFALTLPKAPEFDGHTSADVLERLKNL